MISLTKLLACQIFFHSGGCGKPAVADCFSRSLYILFFISTVEVYVPGTEKRILSAHSMDSMGLMNAHYCWPLIGWMELPFESVGGEKIFGKGLVFDSHLPKKRLLLISSRKCLLDAFVLIKKKKICHHIWRGLFIVQKSWNKSSKMGIKWMLPKSRGNLLVWSPVYYFFCG